MTIPYAGEKNGAAMKPLQMHYPVLCRHRQLTELMIRIPQGDGVGSGDVGGGTGRAAAGVGTGRATTTPMGVAMGGLMVGGGVASGPGVPVGSGRTGAGVGWAPPVTTPGGKGAGVAVEAGCRVAVPRTVVPALGPLTDVSAAEFTVAGEDESAATGRGVEGGAPAGTVYGVGSSR